MFNRKLIVGVFLGLFSVNAFSGQWFTDVTVYSIELFADNTEIVAMVKFENSSGQIVNTCTFEEWSIDESANHKRETLSILMTAQLTNRKLDIYFNDICTGGIQHLSHVLLKKN